MRCSCCGYSISNCEYCDESFETNEEVICRESGSEHFCSVSCLEEWVSDNYMDYEEGLAEKEEEEKEEVAEKEVKEEEKQPFKSNRIDSH